MMEPCDEARIIESCQQGDRLAFGLLFEAHKDRVYSIALYHGGDEAMASDVTQQVFMKLFTNIGRFRRDSEFTTWLYRIVVNACTDEQRKRRRFVPLSDAVEVTRMTVRGTQEERYIKHQMADSVRDAIASLTPKLRMPILLKYVEELSYEEIAQVLGCSIGTVSSRLNRGHKALAQKLAHLREAESPGNEDV